MCSVKVKKKTKIQESPGDSRFQFRLHSFDLRGSNLHFPQTKTVLSLFSICVFVAKLPTHLRHVLGVASRVAGLETEGAGLEKKEE